MNVTYRSKVTLIRAALLAGVLVTIEFLARSGMVPSTELVPLTEMVEAIWTLFASGTIVPHLTGTASRVGIAFGAAIATGIPIGWGLWRNNTLWRILNPYLIVLYAMPIFVFYPLLIILLGLGSLPIIVIAYVMSITAIVISTASGLAKVPDIFFDVSRSLRLTTFQSVTRVQLPAAVPYLFTGLKLGFIYAFIGVIASEFILANSGLGYFVSLSYQRWETDLMYAAIILIITLAVLVNGVLVRVEEFLYERSARQ